MRTPSFIASIFVRFLGSGASLYMIGILIGLSVLALVAVAWPSKTQDLLSSAADLPETDDATPPDTDLEGVMPQR